MQLVPRHTALAPPPAVLRADRHAFFLDLDGTLVEYARSPGAVTIDVELIALLRRLALHTGGALALVSGRSIASLDALLKPLQLPASGLHGFERRNSTGVQTRHTGPDRETLVEVRRLMGQLAARDPGLALEDKRLAFALHYRRVPHLESAIVAAVSEIALLSGGAMEMQRGAMVVELTPPGMSKAAAVAEFMSERPFEGRRPLCVGDDLTDEPAFEWVNAAGGLSVAVNVTRPTAATAQLRSVGEVRAWLGALAEAPG